MTHSAVTVLCAAVVLIGVLGTVVPAMPGLILCLAGVAGWAIFGSDDQSRWLYLGAAVVIALLTWLVKYVAPTKKLKDAGVPWRSLFLGGVLALIGFFVVPVVGVFLGLVLGVFLGEAGRLGSVREAWPTAWTAVKAVGLSMILDIVGAILILGVFATGIYLTTDFFHRGQ